LNPPNEISDTRKLLPNGGATVRVVSVRRGANDDIALVDVEGSIGAAVYKIADLPTINLTPSVSENQHVQ
jgi:hypothetical protein